MLRNSLCEPIVSTFVYARPPDERRAAGLTRPGPRLAAPLPRQSAQVRAAHLRGRGQSARRFGLRSDGGEPLDPAHLLLMQESERGARLAAQLSQDRRGGSHGRRRQGQGGESVAYAHPTAQPVQPEEILDCEAAEVAQILAVQSGCGRLLAAAALKNAAQNYSAEKCAVRLGGGQAYASAVRRRLVRQFFVVEGGVHRRLAGGTTLQQSRIVGQSGVREREKAEAARIQGEQLQERL